VERSTVVMPPRKLILVIEDDESVRKLVERSLATSFAVETVSDGKAALARLAVKPTPDLLVCDVMMPGMDGLEVARRVRAQDATKAIPIIFLTAKVTPRDVIQGIQAGARHYITKPFKIGDLLDKVRKVLGP
jgi:CheY-like chemotaxis protein